MSHSRTISGNHWFGDNNIRHNYQWEIADAGVNANNQAVLSIYYPAGDVFRFTQTSATTWAPPASCSDTITENGNDFYLQQQDGSVYHFQRLTDGNNAVYYQMQDFKDSAQNQTTLTYDSGNPDHLTKVTGPAGRSIQITWGTINSNQATLLGRVISIPPNNAWSTINVSSPAAYRYLWYRSADFGWGNVAEIEFDDANGNKLGGTPFGTPGSWDNQGNVASNAFDNDTNTFFDAPMQSGAVTGQDLGSGNTTAVASIKYFPRASWASRMYYGASWGYLPAHTGEFWGSNDAPAVTDVITSVSSYDANNNLVDTVIYHYSAIPDATLPGISYAELTSVDYDDGTQATFAYTQVFPGTRPLVASYNEPRYDAPLVRAKLAWNTSQIGALGCIWQQQNPDTGEAILTWAADPNNPHAGKAWLANGGTQIFTSSNGPSLNQLTTHTDELGNATHYGYTQNGAGYLNKVTDPLGRTTQYTRDAHFNPLTETLPNGHVRTWTRDSLGLPLTYTDDNGHTTTYTRDANHRVTQIKHPDGSTEHFTYNGFGEVLTHTLRNGGTVTNTYDSTGLKQSSTDALGHTTAYGYDAAGRVNSITDANGHTTTMTYSPRGLVTKITHPDNSTQTFTYDQYGDKLTSTDELGHTTTMTYDWFKRLVTSTDPLSRTTTWSYALPGSGGCACSHIEDNPTQITLPSGKVTAYTYDAKWQKLSQTVGAGTADAATTSWTYDADGEIASVTDPKGNATTFTYGLSGRKDSATDPLGNITKWSYDSVGNVLTQTRPDSGVTTNTYDSMNRLTASTDPKSETTSYTYDNADNMTSLTDAKGNAYHFGYDLLNRKTSMTYPDNSQESWSYDPVNNLSSYTNRAGSVDTYTYDNRNRLTNSSWNDGTTPAVSYTYDVASRLLTQSSSVSALSYAYDNANERTSETQNIATLGSAKTIGYSYDADGNRSSTTYPDGTALSYAYTNRNQLAGVSDGAGSVASYTYDLNGNRTGKTFANGVTTAYSYDAANRLLTLNHTFSATSTIPSQNFTYTLNSVGDRTSRKEALGGVSSTDNYSYDAIDQITEVAYGVINGTVSYNYDAVGNRTSVTDSVNGNTSYTSNNLNQYTNVAAQVPQYDSNGNLTNINGWTYTYDAQNRLLSANNGAGTSETFAYDPQNRCVSRSLTVSGATTTTNFLYDGWELFEELDGSGNEQAAYVSGARIDELLTKSDSTGTVFYHHDGLGSTTALSDASGNLVERTTYDVFGKPSIFDATGSPLTASAYGNRFLFTGREYLSQIGLYDYRNRFYSADLGRFLETDPIRFAAGDVNIYRYVGNDAVNWMDSFGESHHNLEFQGSTKIKILGQNKNVEYDFTASFDLNQGKTSNIHLTNADPLTGKNPSGTSSAGGFSAPVQQHSSISIPSGLVFKLLKLDSGILKIIRGGKIGYSTSVFPVQLNLKKVGKRCYSASVTGFVSASIDGRINTLLGKLQLSKEGSDDHDFNTDSKTINDND